MDKTGLILVVDDSNAARMQICSIIEDAGYKTIQANNGKVAMNAIQDLKPVLVFLDLLMPEMDGIDVLKQMVELNIKIPTIILTAEIEEEVKEECFHLGAADFLNKPVKAQVIKDSILKHYK